MPRSYNFLPKRQGAVELFLGKRFPQERKRCSLRSKGQRRSPPAAPDAGRYGCRETGGRHGKMPRTTVDAKTQHAALAIAARCDRRCRAMRWVMHRTASHRPATQGAAGGTLCGTGERARGESVRARRGGAQGRTPGMLLQEALPHGRQGIRKKALAREHHEDCQARENGAKARSQGSGVACRWGQGHL